ncbi:NAD-dependent epimerase/dehydratase family protein [Hymenobacter negativus]|uniref:NAD(P)-dependent oxidoreductase n=1 Tax=Hymenobacter negativus TaxID=2795026 RepID=A0ABS3QE45_9BACT|nr:NAD(P)-dependent oxidoreductase [Hymenobacter negativus]MBO2009507.1 NAD(P)-dependent oxidoreductase [Hymenobacter negativus]
MPDTYNDSFPQKCLVIGISSILAQEIVRQLLGAGAQVTGVYHRNTGPAVEGLKLVPIAALNTLADDFDSVFFISAYIPRKGEQIDNHRLFDTNVALPGQVCARFPRARVVYASSVSVYGQAPSPRTEQSAVLTPTAYGISKLWGEDVVKAHPLHAIVRISSMYGPGMHAETFLPFLIDAALHTQQLTLLGEGTRRQNYICVADAARVFVRAAAIADNGVFLAADQLGYTNREVAELVAQYIPDVALTYTGTDTTPSFDYDATYTYKTLGLPMPQLLATGLSELILWKQRLS